MTNQQLLDYIRQQLTAGVSRESIKTALMSQGWSEQDVTEGFMMIEKSTVAPIPQTPIPPSPIQPIVPTQSTAVLNEKISAPSSIRYFELLMYASIAVSAVSVAASALQYSQFITAWTLLYMFGVTGFIILARVLCVWLAARRRANWARWVLLVLLLTSISSVLSSLIGFSFGGYANFASTPLAGMLNFLQIGLQVAALGFIFSTSANRWFSLQEINAGATGSSNGVNTIWTKGIPRTNIGFGIVSLLLVFGLDLMIIISSPGLKSFWYLMLGVLAVFAVFFYLENFVFSKKFANSTSNLDNWIVVVVVIRNLIFLLNFIPFIQLVGLAGIVYVGWIIGLIYCGLIIARFNQLRRINP